MPVRVSGGYWVVMCVCGNAPSAHPDWHLACCFECGAIYRYLDVPIDRAEIESVLVRRPMAHRHWVVGETVADLARENAAHGVR